MEIYKKKLKEALTLVPDMSQDKKREAMAYWNDAGVQLSHIVHKNVISYNHTNIIQPYQNYSDEHPSSTNSITYDTSIANKEDTIVVEPLHYDEQDILGPNDHNVFVSPTMKQTQMDEYHQCGDTTILDTLYTDGPCLTSSNNCKDLLPIMSLDSKYQVNPPSSHTYSMDARVLCQNSSVGQHPNVADDVTLPYTNAPYYPPVDLPPQSTTTHNLEYFPIIGTNMSLVNVEKVDKCDLHPVAQHDNSAQSDSTYDSSTISHNNIYESPMTYSPLKSIAQTTPLNQADPYDQVNSYTRSDSTLQQIQLAHSDNGYYLSQTYIATDDRRLFENHTQEANSEVSSLMQVKCEISAEGDIMSQQTCTICHKHFSTRGNLKRHLRSHSQVKPFQCNFQDCSSRFTEKKSLKIHMRRHTGEKPYMCKICDKGFSQSGVLQSHMNIHSNKKPFQCEKCKKSFRQRSQLSLHLLRHENIKKLACDQPNCSARFLTRGDLERHVRTHLNVKPYTCEQCNRSFTRMQSLNEHRNRHSGDRPYDCPCGKTFFEMSACYKHKKSCDHCSP